jgi:alpha-tubulin suppressor-like RCC1 family protein
MRASAVEDDLMAGVAPPVWAGEYALHHLQDAVPQPEDSPARRRHLLQQAQEEKYSFIRSYQWNMDMIGAWELGNRTAPVGMPAPGEGTVICVLDSGLALSAEGAFSRPASAGQQGGPSSRILPGYDMVSDPAKSMDGDGRDADFHDPGDSHPVLCPSASSWHGTAVSSVAAASYRGFVGVAPRASVLHVRVLGRCGSGYASDISDGIVWAAGGNILGVAERAAIPAHPAERNRVIVLSLTGYGKCTSFMQSAVDLALSRNITVYVAAGNDRLISARDQFPGNCHGVISVGALNPNKLEASYSSPHGDVYMPGGDSNAATRVPCLRNDIDVTAWLCVGTSFAAPHAAALHALTWCAGSRDGTYRGFPHPRSDAGAMCARAQGGQLAPLRNPHSKVWKGFLHMDMFGGSLRSHVAAKVSSAQTGMHACAILLPLGRIKCWGLNWAGQLGIGNTTDMGYLPNTMGDKLPFVDTSGGGSPPTQFTPPGGIGATSICTGPSHTCVVLMDGTVKCWGFNDQGQLGFSPELVQHMTSPSQTPVQIGTEHGHAVDVVCGYVHTCALTSLGFVKCWGNNWFGQSGAQSVMISPPHTVNLGTGVMARSIAAGDSFNCAVLAESGDVKCWGDNQWGQLGLGSPKSRWGSSDYTIGDWLPTVNLGSGERAVQVRAGLGHACALLEGGRIKCWGRNWEGQLGLGDVRSRGEGNRTDELGDMLPFVDTGEGNASLASSISLGNYHSCAVLQDRTVKCWGRNLFGALGYAATGQETLLSPTMQGSIALDRGSTRGAVPLRSRSVSIFGDSACSISADPDDSSLESASNLHCWGDNWYGQLGMEDDLDRDLGPSSMDKVDLGSFFCSACPVGKYSHDDFGCREDRCLECAPGSFSDEADMPECKLCPTGTYSPFSGARDASVCAACPPGMLPSKLIGASSCTFCQSGSFMQGDQCLPCPPGTYSNFVDGVQLSCHPCAEGRFSTAFGSTNCTLCPTGTSSSLP